MAKFNGFLDATFLPPRNWTLDADLTFTSDTIKEDEVKMLRDCNVTIIDNNTIVVPKGYITDLASVPRLIWAVISPFDVARADVIHDLLYEYINMQYKVVNNSAAAEEGPASKGEREYYREVADNIFREAMRNSEPKVPGWKIWSAYTAVRIFGRWAINGSQPRKAPIIM